ncbi:hypothetical protein [Thermococcus sp. Bubb.Bath]|uniref:hypothetical protein n=1 Tax=Thermococcus sp. Bubb.Bath TaxID=1638242 RepID=UPI00143AD1C9|nr:hypothetical protein [Thermococcus sp. Bubb.Bath]NJF25166.1 hypothetical protein [Thermococcus sp. Bubb.Bath]
MMTMPSFILDFQKLLQTLATLFGMSEFDSKTAAKAVAEYLYLKEKDSRILGRATPKLISNDLRRLYQMGFLRRRKVPRRCKNKKGKKYNCGYKYMYEITAQGWRYLKHLRERPLFFTLKDIIEIYSGVPVIAKKATLIELLERDDIGKLFVLVNLITDDINRIFSSRGFRRFQMQEHLFKQWTTLLAYHYSVISELENQIKQRDLRISLLMEELKRCREQKNRLGALNLPYYLQP